MSFLLYGAYGYAGRLIAHLAVQRGVRPVLAGRDGGKLAEVASETGLESVTVGLDDPAALDRALADVPLVLHAAGPFSRTSAPMVQSCLRTGTHYLDVTGEIAVFEALDGQARQHGDAALPPMAVRMMKMSRALGPVLRSAPAQSLLRAAVSRAVSGPSDADRQRGGSFAWARATDDAGRRATAVWSGPEGYALTADAALRSARAVLEGRAEVGFQTPSRAFGADFALEMEGTAREDVA